MAEQRVQGEPGPVAAAGRAHGRAPLRRRGLLAGAVALVATGLAKVTTQPAEAADGKPLIVGQPNSAALVTSLNLHHSLAKGLEVWGTNANLQAIVGHSGQSAAPLAQAAGPAGVVGLDDHIATNGAGVRGESHSGRGVVGRGKIVGVNGSAQSGTGVRGDSISGDGVYGVSATKTGVRGESAIGVAVQGKSLTGNGTGVEGHSQYKTGVRGSSGSGIGVVGTAGRLTIVVGKQNIGVLGAAGSGTGVHGGTSSGIGLHGTATSANGKAAQFDGPVVINGSLTLNGQPITAAAAPDGSSLQMAAPRQSERWVEDFGAGTLVDGVAEVRLEPAFATVVHGGEYHVFLTPEGDCRGLYVSGKSPADFVVREQQGGTGSLAFSYRVVARRGDATAPRRAQAIV